MNANDILSDDHRDLLDVVDRLRAQGLSHYVDLPEIIVTGDQKAGKSSVLEAISGIKFPAKDTLCTRFATELVLRRGPRKSPRVSITPGEGRYDKDRETVEAWEPKASIETNGLEAVTAEAERLMADPFPRRFYDDILRIELTGPDQPHLTMIDLPGLFRAGNKDQSDADAKVVHDMVERYMMRPRCIILTVVSAKYDFVLQSVTAMAQKADPGRIRTLGLITKPDTLDVGSDSEGKWLRTAQNEDLELHLGWHILRNRSYEEMNVSSAERDANEEDFFSKGIWTSLDRADVGVSSLKTKLNSALKDQISYQLPSVVHDVETGIRDCLEKLERLGPVRNTREEQARYLAGVSEVFTSLMGQSVNGTYTDPFFGNRTGHGFWGRLRARIQDHLLEFSKEMRRNGQTQHIFDSDDEDTEAEEEDEVSQAPRISRSEYLKDVTRRLRLSRGCELPGLFNPLIVGDLFTEQCEHWREIVARLADNIIASAQQTMRLLVDHIVAKDVAEEIFGLVSGKTEALRVNMVSKIQELLPSDAQHPITYSRQLTEIVQRVHNDRHKRALEKEINATFATELQDPEAKIRCNPRDLLKLSAFASPFSMEHYGSALATDYMEVYYEVGPASQSSCESVRVANGVS